MRTAAHISFTGTSSERSSLRFAGVVAFLFGRIGVSKSARRVIIGVDARRCLDVSSC